MLPADPSAIFNQEHYKIDEVLKSIRQDNVFERLFKAQQSGAPQSANNPENYDGNYITINGKTLFAMAGPADDVQLNSLLHEFNCKEKTINIIISLLKKEEEYEKYCVKYFHKGFKANCRDFDLLIENVVINGNKIATDEFVDYDTHCVCTHLSVSIKKSSKQLPLKIYSLPVSSGGVIIKKESSVDKINQNINLQYINFLLDCIDEWFDNGIVAIHCEFGSKRTALLVITFFLVAEFDKIFIINNPRQTAQNIFHICQQIMQQRKVFNPDAIQFYSAINLAFRLKIAKEYQFACTKQSSDTSLLSSPFSTTSSMSHMRIKDIDEILRKNSEIQVEHNPMDNNLISSRKSVKEQTADTLFWKNTNIKSPAPVSGEKDKPQTHNNDFKQTITLA